MRHVYQTLALLAITLILSLRPTPRLIPNGTVGSDLRALAQETWRLFLGAFQGRSDCFGDVRLHAARELKGRAAYDPNTATVTVQVPATVAMLQGAMVHEWAHHIEHQCKAHHELRPAFLAAQELPVDTPWQLDYVPAAIPESEWARIPSEQFAEATIELVLGERHIPTSAPVRAEAVSVIAGWASRR